MAVFDPNIFDPAVFDTGEAVAALEERYGGSGGRRRRDRDRWLLLAERLAELRASEALEERVEAQETVGEAVAKVAEAAKTEAIAKAGARLAARFARWAEREPTKPVTITEDQTEALARLLETADKVRTAAEAREARERDDEEALLLLS